MTRASGSFAVVQKLLHWLMAASIIAMLFVGAGMVSDIDPAYAPLVSAHKSLGIIVLLLVAVRLPVRFLLGAPALPADLPWPMRLGAHLSHYALYATMFAMPLLGWAMMSAASYPVVIFGGMRLPPIAPHNARLHAVLFDAHAVLAYAFFALILMHVGAALFHALIRRDGVFEAMTVRRKTPAAAAE